VGTAQGEPPLSKKQGQGKKRRKQARARKRRDTAPAGLLAALAAALNNCEQHGVKIRFRHGAAYSFYGVVLPPEGKGQVWDARVFRAVAGSPDVECDDGED
jgi:hypothetical protein